MLRYSRAAQAPPPQLSALGCASAFSFLEGASAPEELVERAVELGLPAIAIADRDGVYGLPRAHRRLRELQREGAATRLICGARVTVEGGPGLVLLAREAAGWAQLCRVITAARCGGMVEEELGREPDPAAPSPHGRPGVEKGRARLPLTAVLERSAGLEAVLWGSWGVAEAAAVREAMGDRASLGLDRPMGSRDGALWAQRRDLAARAGLPLLADLPVLMHSPARRRVLDVMSAIRLGCTVDQLGAEAAANAAAHLRAPAALAALYAQAPAALERNAEISARCLFSLDSLAYRYPREVVPEGHSPMSWLRELVERGLLRRYPAGTPEKVRRAIEHEMGIIGRLDFPAYFLTVHDAVRYADEQGILCQGRGSAANSAVCFALGITSVDPASSSLLFERFISEERGEPPDIDVDFEHERREEVFQYIYRKYGRHRAAMVSEVISWRRRSAARDVGKALGLSMDQVDALAGALQWFDRGTVDEAQLREAGLDPRDRRVQLTVELSAEMQGLPRHVGIHVGGFTISDGPLIELVPVEPATMEDRTILQWDKDDLDVVGFVKVDLLALGMLTAIRKAFALIASFHGRILELATVPGEDPLVYDMICAADTVGVFQIESRAQMSMLPRLLPRCWYDLVIEVSIVRPGPIQGGMVHPYLRRRRKEEEVIFVHDDLRPILERTLGVPIFQEQVMAMAIAVGGFTPGEADQLRRAMGAWRRKGGLEAHSQRLIAGMLERGIPQDYAERIAAQIQGFGEYGFPESHAASFARLVYISCWIKRHYPAAFTAALLNSQPMGFYSPRALVGDLRRHGVEVRPLDLRHSGWDCHLEEGPTGAALRLGLRLLKGLREEAVRRMEALRGERPFQDLSDLARRGPFHQGELSALARAGALAGFGEDRRQLLWAVEGLYHLPLFRGLARQEEGPAPLSAPTSREELAEDYALVGLSVQHDPVRMARPQLRQQGVRTAVELDGLPAGRLVKVAGIISHRQRPGTASGMLFMTMEDETGMLNLVVKPQLFEAQRGLILGSNLLRTTARLQRDGQALSLLCLGFEPFPEAPEVETHSRDFR